jgi:hypothetical protein
MAASLRCCWGPACCSANDVLPLRKCACGNTVHSNCATFATSAAFAGNALLCDLTDDVCGQCGERAAALQSTTVQQRLAEYSALFAPPPLPPRCTCPAAGGAPFMPGQGPGEASEQQAARLIACCSGLRGSGSLLCDVPRCKRSSADDTTLSLCPCCNLVALCSDCAAGLYNPFPLLAKAMEEDATQGRAPLCPACVEAAFCAESWFDEAASLEATAVRALQPQLLTQRDLALQPIEAPSAIAPNGVVGSAPPGISVKPGALMTVPKCSPRIVYVAKSVGSDGVTLEALPDQRRFIADGTGRTEERPHGDVTLLSDLLDAGASTKGTSLYGLRTFCPFGDDKPLYFAVHSPGFERIAMGDLCTLRDEYGLTGIVADAPLIFVGVTKAGNSARCALLLHSPSDGVLMLLALPPGCIKVCPSGTPTAPNELMPALERVRFLALTVVAFHARLMPLVVPTRRTQPCRSGAGATQHSDVCSLLER